jgi:hypothetical protein
MIMNDPIPTPEVPIIRKKTPKNTVVPTPAPVVPTPARVVPTPARVVIVPPKEVALKGLSLDQIKRLNYGVGRKPPVMSRPQIDYLIEVFRSTPVLFGHTMKEID